MQLTGLIAAPHTPFNPDFTLNLEVVPLQARHLADSGVKGVFVAGTTGECHSLSSDERAELFTAWGEVARAHGIKFIAHTGHNSLPDARALAKSARAAGAARPPACRQRHGNHQLVRPAAPTARVSPTNHLI